MTRLDDAIANVYRARKRLASEQGRLARKNARAAVKAAVATVLRAMDREFPLIAKERVVRVSMSPIAKKRRQRAKRIALVLVLSAEALTLATMGIKVVSSEKETRAPSWVVRALRSGIAPAEIKRAVRSRTVRNRIEAAVRLKSS